MPRSIAISCTSLLPLALACGGTPPPAPADPSTPPAEAAPEAEPEGPSPPMYKPSSRSQEPMSIADPAYGAYGDAPDAPGMGATLPDFEVALADGGTFAMAEARKAGPVLVMFYRGFW
ncbi:MAG: hypothetical protein K0V04_35195 [Deltaproteobacteria bacterium]|nr:hypothetical protein [Deltaproteobacteria bacterium]